MIGTIRFGATFPWHPWMMPGMCCRAGGGSGSTQLQQTAHLDRGGLCCVLTYTRCAATSGTCRIRERRNPAAASHFTPPRRACRQPPRRNVTTAGLGERTTEEGRLPFPDPRDYVPTFPPLSVSTRRQLSACELRDARPPVLKLVDRLRAAQLKMRAGRRCHPLKTVRAGNSNEPCCSFLPARGAVVTVLCG